MMTSRERKEVRFLKGGCGKKWPVMDLQKLSRTSKTEKHLADTISCSEVTVEGEGGSERVVFDAGTHPRSLFSCSQMALFLLRLSNLNL
jgi:hypothetical protein